MTGKGLDVKLRMDMWVLAGGQLCHIIAERYDGLCNTYTTVG